MNDLASAYRAVGKLNQALKLNEEIYKHRRVKLGPDHLETLKCMKSLAFTYWSLNLFDKSIPLYEEILRYQETKLGRQHPDTIHTLANLGVNYKDAGKLTQALPLLEEGYQSSKKLSALRFTGSQLLDGYVLAGKHQLALTLSKELLVDIRQSPPKDSSQLAGELANFASAMLQAKSFAEAEPLLRESLAIREKAQANAWTTFNTKSMLGYALLGQKKYADAEPLLIEGYQGMFHSQKNMSVHQQSKLNRERLNDTLEQIVALYEAWDKPSDADKWRKEYESRRNSVAKSLSP